MRTTAYFRHTRTRPDRCAILDGWIERVLSSAAKTEVQHDGRLRLWGSVTEAGGRYLRVIVLADGKTVHNAFFDRDLSP